MSCHQKRLAMLSKIRVKFNMTLYKEPQEEIIEIWGKSGPHAKQEAMNEIGYLWKLDDPAWVAKRNSDWELIKASEFPNTPKKERKVYEQYFKFGIRNEYFDGLNTMMLTPYTNASEFNQVLTSRLIGNHDRWSIYSEYIYNDKI